MISELARLDVRDPAGVFAARQLGRELAASLDLDRQDQIRVATALSEISRSAVTAGRTAAIAFGIDDTDLLLTVTLDGEPPSRGHRRGRPAHGPGHHRRQRRADDANGARQACGPTCDWSTSSWRPCSRSPRWRNCGARTRI